jgi:hypothetical protein
VQVGPGGLRQVRIEAFLPPPRDSRGAAWLEAPRWEPAQINVGMMGLADWLGGALGPNASARSIRVMHLTPTGSGEDAAVMAARGHLRVLLLSDRELRGESALGTVNAATLISAWYQAISTAAAGERQAAA